VAAEAPEAEEAQGAVGAEDNGQSKINLKSSIINIKRRLSQKAKMCFSQRQQSISQKTQRACYQNLNLSDLGLCLSVFCVK
jgi:hypothetical protein